MYKKFLAVALFSAMAISMLTSCSQQGTMEKPFFEEEITKYSPLGENSALTIYVDVNAENSGDGSESSPFKTIQEAQAKIREIKAGAGLPTGGITVLVKEGEYKLDSAITFTEEDSGTEDCPITYVSESEFGAVLSGGLILSASDFEPINEDEKSLLIDSDAKERVVKVDLTKYGLDVEDWGLLYSRGSTWSSNYDNAVGPEESEIFINGNRQTLARYPNEGFISIKEVIDTGISHEYYGDPNFNSSGVVTLAHENYNVRNPQGGIFTVNEEVQKRMSLWSSLENIWTFGYYKWQWSYATPPVKTIDIANATVELGQTVSYGVSIGAPFYFYNIFDELDTEGEYYIDRVNGILYLYKPDDFNSAEIMMSCTTDKIISASNVSYLTLKGFGVCGTRNVGIVMSGNNSIIDNCKIYNVRGFGISASGTNMTVQNCEITKVGKGGISISGGDPDTLTSSNNLVYNNYIHDWAVVDRTYQSGIEIGGCGVTVSHNELATSPHQAIGWSGPNHIVEYNEIYNVCFETSDCGAVYGGRNMTSYGCIFRYNYIHDIGSGTAAAHGIYWDDGLSGQTAYGNIIVNSTSHAFLIGGGRDNVVKNNIVINMGNVQIKSPISYDNRTRDGMLYEWAWFVHDEELANGIKVDNEAWNEAFPTYGKLVRYYNGYDGDTEDPMLSCNPANNSVKNNISYFRQDLPVRIDEEDLVHNIAPDIYLFSEIENNPIIKYYIADFPGWHNDDFTMKLDSKAKELCPDFEPIPFDQIGRVN